MIFDNDKVKMGECSFCDREKLTILVCTYDLRRQYCLDCIKRMFELKEENKNGDIIVEIADSVVPVETWKEYRQNYFDERYKDNNDPRSYAASAYGCPFFDKEGQDEEWHRQYDLQNKKTTGENNE